MDNVLKLRDSLGMGKATGEIKDHARSWVGSPGQ